MPLTYDPNRVVIIAASSPGRWTEEALCYNVDPAAPGFKLVYVPADLPAVLALPVETPWTIVGGTGAGALVALRARFGPERKISDALYVLEVDNAWRKPMTDRI